MNISKKTSRSRNRSGFSLIEILIAMAVIGIGFLAAATMQGMSISSNTKSRHWTSASYLCQDKFEHFRNVPFEDVTTAGSPEANIDELGNPGGIFTRTWTVAMDTPAALMRTVTVTVSWVEKGVNRSVVMTTVIISLV